MAAIHRATLTPSELELQRFVEVRSWFADGGPLGAVGLAAVRG